MSSEALSLWLSPPVLALLGLCIGSFLNVVIHRKPRMLEREWWEEVAQNLADSDAFKRCFGSEPSKALQTVAAELEKKVEDLAPYNLMRPRSACPACGHQIRWHENIPVIGWLRLRGRCSACKTPISPRYPLMEVATALLFAGAGWHYGAQPIALMWCGVLATLLALAAIDADTTMLPDDYTIPLMGAGLFAASMGWTIPLKEAIWGLLVGYLSLWSINQVFKLARGMDGMGMGDFKLLAGLGVWLGLKALLPVILISSIIGTLVAVGMKLTRGLRPGQYIPFGPYLAGAGAVVILAGTPRVLGWIGWD